MPHARTWYVSTTTRFRIIFKKDRYDSPSLGVPVGVFGLGTDACLVWFCDAVGETQKSIVGCCSGSSF